MVLTVMFSLDFILLFFFLNGEMGKTNGENREAAVFPMTPINSGRKTQPWLDEIKPFFVHMDKQEQ